MSDDPLDQPIGTLGRISTRLINPLTKDNITTIRALVAMTEQEFMCIPGLGQTALGHLKHLLYVRGLSFRDPDDEGHPPLPFPSMHERLLRIEQRLDALEARPLLREVGDMSGHASK